MEAKTRDLHNPTVTSSEEEAETEGSEAKVTEKPKVKRELDKPQLWDSDTESDANPSLASEPVEETLKKKKKPRVASALRKCEKERERQWLDQLGSSARGPPLGFNTLALGPADAGGGGCMSFTEPLFRLLGSIKEPALDSDSDCGLVSENSCSFHSLPPASTDACQPLSLPDWTEDGTRQGTRGHTKAEDTASQACPEGCPPVLEDSIHKLMLASKTSRVESKSKFYTPEINNLLLQIDMQCRLHGGALRSRVYSHLCSFLPCNKGTLLRRVGRLKHSLNVPVQEELDVD
ncbi:ubinuclein-1 [Eucyclogobius newberryi]|uniref:ubinuclein-1 n=1 Tax=Eucyclogobius newberryi TaxID=166745 RepID=UPI003B59BAFE